MTRASPQQPGSPAAVFDVVCVPIGEYRCAAYKPLPADEEARSIAEVLSGLGGRADEWPLAPEERHRTKVDARLGSWAKDRRARNSVVLWVGHGSSNGDDAYLATYDSDEGEGIAPEDLAQTIRTEWGNRRADKGVWTIVVIEACGAKRFAQRLSSVLQGKANVPERLAVIGVGSEGASHLGDFRAALSKAIGSYTDNDEQIRLEDLVGRVRGHLDEKWVQDLALDQARPIPRPRELAGTVTAPVDIYTELKAFLAGLTPDEQNHFVPKAQGGEQGELAWYFVGRGREREAIADWLRTSTSRILIVTGPAGSGKSALLGNVLVHTNPTLHALLTKAGHLESIPDSQRPPEQAFDAVLHLAGMTTSELVRRLADAAGPSMRRSMWRNWTRGLTDDPGPPFPLTTATADRDVEALLSGLRDRPFTLMVDALDEAQEPVSIASVLRRIAALPRGRVVIGTRRSTKEGPDQPDTMDEDLLDALGGASSAVIVHVDRDPDAIASYVRRRLSAARTTGTPDVDNKAVDRVVDLVGAQQHQFLFARLAIHEILARPSLLDTANEAELTELLGRDHRALFAVAVDRLTAAAPANFALLHALALAQGRGLPQADRIWAIAATALAEDGTPVTESDIKTLWRSASPYVMLDAEDGQSVYRLAHQTFREHFVAHTTRADSTNGALAHGHHRIAHALIAAAEADLPASPSPYVVHHLSTHIAAAGSWADLAKSTVLDHLDPNVVATDAFRTAFGRSDLPVEIAASMTARHMLAAQPPNCRAGTRQLAVARLRNDRFRAPDSAPWSMRWAALQRELPHVVLVGDNGTESAMAAVPLADGRVLLATASRTTVRLWDPTTGQPVGEPLTGHTKFVSALAAVPLPDGRALLATGSHDHTVRLWDPVTGQPVGDPLTGLTPWVSAIAAVRPPDGRVLLATATGSGMRDGTVRLWDPATRQPVGEPLTSHKRGVSALAAVPLPDGRVLLATSEDKDGTVQLWDPATMEPVGKPLTGHDRLLSHLVAAPLAAVPLVDGRVLLAAGGDRGSVRLWDPVTGLEVGEPFSVPYCTILAVAAVPLVDGRVLLATGDIRGSVQLWDPNTGQPVGGSLSGHSKSVSSLVALPLADGRVLLATSSSDGTVQLCDPTTTPPVETPTPGHEREVSALAVVPQADGRTLLATSENLGRTVRLWELFTGRPVSELTARAGTRLAAPLTAVPRSDGRTLLATGEERNGTVRLWDPTTGQPVGGPLAHTGRVMAAVAVAYGRRSREWRHRRRVLLATGDSCGTVRLWDPTTGQQVGVPLAGHTQQDALHHLGRHRDVSVSAIAALSLAGERGLLAVGRDGTVLLCDLTTGALVEAPRPDFGREMAALAALPLADGKVLLAAAEKWGGLRTFDPANGEWVHWPHSNRASVVATVPLTDGRVLLATGSDNGTVDLWDPQTRRNVLTIMVGDGVSAITAVDGGLAVGLRKGVAVLDLNLAGLGWPQIRCG